MTRPLTKIGLNGALYTRPPKVETQIEEAVQLTLRDLQPRLRITDRDDPRYLRHECLVHLVRQGRYSGDEALISAVLPVLLTRCEANLLVHVPDGKMPDAASLREEILAEFSELFATDGSGEHPDDLDFYECKFNRAFRTLRIDAVRREARRLRHVASLPPPDAESEVEFFEEAFARLSDATRILSPHEEYEVREHFSSAIDALPADERKAVMLVHYFGYKVESQDPDEETAATRCNCTGRTIRNRLRQAAAKLSVSRSTNEPDH